MGEDEGEGRFTARFIQRAIQDSANDQNDSTQIGDVHVNANETESHVIPLLVSEGAIALGAILLAAGLVKR